MDKKVSKLFTEGSKRLKRSRGHASRNYTLYSRSLRDSSGLSQNKKTNKKQPREGKLSHGRSSSGDRVTASPRARYPLLVHETSPRSSSGTCHLLRSRHTRTAPVPFLLKQRWFSVRDGAGDHRAGLGAVAETAPVRSQHAPFRGYARQLALLSNSPAANRPSLPLPISGPEDFLLPSRGWRSPERQKATILYPRRLRLFSCFW